MSDSVERKTISDSEAERIHSMQNLDTFLPVVFENGSRVDKLTIICSCCGSEKQPEEIKASGSVLPHSASLNIWGICYECRLITPSAVRLRDDGSMLTRDPGGNWTEGRYAEEKKTGVWTAVKSIISRLIVK